MYSLVMILPDVSCPSLKTPLTFRFWDYNVASPSAFPCQNSPLNTKLSLSITPIPSGFPFTVSPQYTLFDSRQVPIPAGRPSFSCPLQQLPESRRYHLPSSSVRGEAVSSFLRSICSLFDTLDSTRLCGTIRWFCSIFASTTGVSVSDAYDGFSSSHWINSLGPATPSTFSALQCSMILSP